MLVLSVAFFAGEVATRIYLQLRTPQGLLWIPDPILGVTHLPNSTFEFHLTEPTGKEMIRRRTNSHGFVGKEISKTKPSDVYRVVVLGDSFTEALQVHEGESYSELVQISLSKSAAEQKIEVINAGVSGYSPMTYYLYLKRELLSFKPDLVLLQLFANDVFEDHKTAAMSVFDENNVPVQINRYFKKEKRVVSEVFYKFDRALKKISRFYAYLMRSFAKLGKKSSYNKEMTAKEEFSDFNQFFPIQPGTRLYRNESFHQQAIGRTLFYLKSIHELLKTKSIPLVVFYIPNEAQVHQSKTAQSAFYLTSKVSDDLNRELAQFFNAEEIPFLDLTSAFKASQSPDKLYYPNDGHLTPRGHQLVARELGAFLKSPSDPNVSP